MFIYLSIYIYIYINTLYIDIDIDISAGRGLATRGERKRLAGGHAFSECHIRGWRAVSAAGLQGNCEQRTLLLRELGCKATVNKITKMKIIIIIRRIIINNNDSK